MPESDGLVDTKNRDYLANERTFLAYLRTALAFIAFGFVVARFSLFAREISSVAHVELPHQQASTAFGTGTAIAGIFVALYGSFRYIATDAAIRQSDSSRLPVWACLASGVVVALIGVVVAITLLQLTF